MKRKTLTWILVLSAAVSTGLPARPALAEDEFTLASAVPEDVFLFMNAAHNPEREFLDKYWGEVLDALSASGIGTDAMELISSLIGEEGSGEFERIKTLATELIEGVDWEQLPAREFAYAMRMPRGVQQGENYNVGGPHMVWMFRGAKGSGQKNYAGMTAIFDTLAAEINKAAQGEFLTVKRSEQLGAELAVLAWPMPVPEEMRYDLRLARRGDLIVMAMGHNMMSEVLGLLEGKASIKPIASKAGFKKAFARLPQAEDGRYFFDMKQMLADLETIANTAISVAAKMGPGGADIQVTHDPEALELNRQAFEAYEGKDYAKALELARKAHEVAPEDAVVMYNIGCFSALTGNREEALSWLEKSVQAGYTDADQIASDPDLKSLREDPRYQAALTEASAAGESPRKEWLEKVAMVKRIVDRLMGVASMIDHIATVEYTDKYTVHMDTVTVLAPDAKSRPFYPVIANPKPLKEYKRYLPKQTMAFSVGSPIDLEALYKFIEDSFHEVGPVGDGLWAQWEGMQEKMGVNVRQDVLSWIQGNTVTVSIAADTPGAQPASVMMMRVKDEAVAREKVDSAITFVSKAMQEMAAQNQMMMMFMPRVSPTQHEKLDGFQNIQIGAMPQPLVWGTADNHLIFGTSADAVALCLATAAGEHPDVTRNAQVMDEALLPEGPFQAVSYTDQRGLGQQLAQIIGMTSLVSMPIMMAVPPEAQPIASKILGMITKLSPVAQKIDFFKSTASYTTFDGKVGYTRQITNYFSPSERSAPAM